MTLRFVRGYCPQCHLIIYDRNEFNRHKEGEACSNTRGEAMTLHDKAKEPLTLAEMAQAMDFDESMIHVEAAHALTTAAYLVALKDVLAVLRERGAHEQADYIEGEVAAVEDNNNA